MILGSHVGFGKDQILGSLKEALSYNANAFMFYTGAPQNTLRSKIDLNIVEEFKKEIVNNNIDINNIICHAPYIINLANNINKDSWDFSISFLKQEIERCELLGVKYIVLHPGSSVKLSREDGITNIVEALKIVLSKDINCTILLETMAGKGSECGITTKEIKEIIDRVNSNNLGVCLDTCHLNDAGYDMKNFDNYLDEFDKMIGINKIKCVHLNDSKNEISSHKDRHANIGYGTIGFTTLLNVLNNDRLKDVPKILETPYVSDGNNTYPPYKFEIEMLKNGSFNINLMEDIINYYK